MKYVTAILAELLFPNVLKKKKGNFFFFCSDSTLAELPVVDNRALDFLSRDS